MKVRNVFKRTLYGVFAVGLFSYASIPASCVEWFTDLDEYIQKSNEEWAAEGYSSDNGTGTIYPAQTSPANEPDTTGTNEASTGSNVVKTCEHDYTDSIVKEPTCAEPGMMESKCSKCGDTYKTEIAPTGKHTYTSETTKEATCTETGENTYTCSVCGDSYTEEIPVTEHDYQRTVAEDATCTTVGTFVYICSVCNDSYTEEIPASGHTLEEIVTKNAGTFTQGEKVVKCSTCGDVISTEVIPSKYPVYYIYIGIALFVALVIAALMTFRSKKSGIKRDRKTA